MTRREFLNKDKTDDDHHPFGPSSLARRLKCPGSYELERWVAKHMPDLVHEWTAEGTLLHSYVAAELDPDKPVIIQMDSVRPDDEQLQLVERAVGFTKGIVDRYDLRHQMICVERRVRVLDPDHKPKKKEKQKEIYFGTADVFWVDKKRIRTVVVDHKFGYLPYDEAECAIQLAAYICAICEEFGLKEGYGHLFMPRLGLDGWVHVENPKEYLDRIKEIIKTSRAPLSPRIVGNWCRYCKAQGVCEENTAHAKDFQLEVAKVPDIAVLPIDRLLHFAQMLKPVENAAKAVRARIRACLLDDPKSLGDGWTITQENGSRKADLWELYKHLKTKFPALEMQEYLQNCKVSVAQVEKLLGTMGMKPKKFKEITATVVDQPKQWTVRQVK